MCLMDRGQLVRNSFKQGSLLRRTVFQLLRLLLSFDRFPVFDYFFRRRGRLVPENVCMPAHQFSGNLFDDSADVELARLFCEMSMEYDVKQQISEFLSQSVEVLVIDGLENLIDLFNQHWFKRVEILLLVPRT